MNLQEFADKVNGLLNEAEDAVLQGEINRCPEVRIWTGFEYRELNHVDWRRSLVRGEGGDVTLYAVMDADDREEP